MFYNSRCFVCLEIIENSNRYLCQCCNERAIDLLWYSCTRCGRADCLSCENLIEFSEVHSLYTYAGGFPDLLVLAKDKNDVNAQELFFDFFFVPVKNYIYKICEEHKYSHIFLSPMRRERILNSPWHTNLFFKSVLKSLKNEFKAINYFPSFIMPQKTGKSMRQSLLPINIRNKINNELINKRIIFNNMFSESGSNLDVKKVLILDDVLTTGNTLLKFNEVLNELYLNLGSDVFTIFRSPQK